MKIVIVGVGALGSHAALALRNVDDLVVVDFDRVEAKNCKSQFHTVLDVGKNKAQALAKALYGLFKTRCVSTPYKVSSDNIREVVGNADLVIDCTDNFEARETLINFSRSSGTPCLHGSISADGSVGRVVWSEFFQPDHEGNGGVATCEDGANLPFHVLMGATIAHAAMKFLRDKKKGFRSLIVTSSLTVTKI